MIVLARAQQNGTIARGKAEMKIRLNKKTIRRGLSVFFGVSLASIVVVFLFTDSADTIAALHRIEPLYLLAALGVTAVDLLGGGLRMYVLTRGMGRPLKYSDALRSSVASIAMGAVTPSQAGGGPAMIFILYRSGLTVAEAMSAGLMSFVVTVLFYVLAAAGITLSGINTSVDDPTIQGLFHYGLGVFMVIGVVFIVFTTWPNLLRGLLRAVFQFVSRFRRRPLLRPGSRANALFDLIADFHNSNKMYFGRRLPEFIASFFITAVIFSSKCFLAWLVVRGLGVHGDIWQVMSLQILILLAIYFFPTPGGAGAAELGSAVLMANILPAELLPVYVVIWRVIVMYVAVVAGSVVMLHMLVSDSVVAEGPRDIAVEHTDEKKIAVSVESP